jgi:hypothetical protein
MLVAGFFHQHQMGIWASHDGIMIDLGFSSRYISMLMNNKKEPDWCRWQGSTTSIRHALGCHMIKAEHECTRG